MKHRHINIESGQWSVAAVESIWERGADADVLELLAEVRGNPHGQAANAVRHAIPHSHVYGYPALFKLVLEAADVRQG